jgi:hypothetical protein
MLAPFDPRVAGAKEKENDTMTKQEYADYEKRVTFYLNGLEFISTGPCPGCEKCGIPEDAENYEEEPWFSKNPCEICSRLQGGMRESWHAVLTGETLNGVPQSDRILHGDCCTDCVYYLNYGRLDDTTMDEINHAQER